MPSSASVFDMDTFTVTRSPVPDPGSDSSVPAINQGAGSGSRIVGAGFLSAPNLQSGQDQVLVHAGDQSVLLDKNRHQWIHETEFTTIEKERHTEVKEDEIYENKQKTEHRVGQEYKLLVNGPFIETHNKTTEGNYKGEYKVTYHDQFVSKEMHNQWRYKTYNEYVLHNGWGVYLEYPYGRVQTIAGPNLAFSTPLRATTVIGGDIKTAVAFDVGWTSAKHSASYLDSKFTVCEMKNAAVNVDTALASLNTKGVLARLGAACLKGAVLCFGNIRW